MRVRKQFFFLLMVLVLPAATLFAQPIIVNSAQYAAEADQSKVILGVTDAPKYRVFVLDNPARLVVDFKNAKAKRSLSQPPASHPLFAHARTAQKNESDLRVVIDLKQPISADTYKLVTKSDGKEQIVIKLQGKQGQAIASKSVSSKTVASRKIDKKEKLVSETTAVEKDENVKTVATKSKRSGNKKRFIVAIDAGHGGDDPGASGPNGTKEKIVTLAIAKKLKALINAEPGMVAKLVRKGDYYVGLRERMRIARLNRADLFISIHADAVNNPEVRGASVYALSSHGASSEAARWLANHENAKEKIGGVNLDDKDEVLASVLLDLSQTATQQASITLANKILRNFQGIGSLHYHAVQKAGFAVLKSPDIPSILVETAYISNPSDELNLLSNRYQSKIAHAIFKGVVNYFDQMEPAETNKIAKM